jgi:hypothetical protein
VVALGPCPGPTTTFVVSFLTSKGVKTIPISLFCWTLPWQTFSSFLGCPSGLACH